MKRDLILDACSSYTTINKIDTNSYNTHILNPITIIYEDGTKEKCYFLICNNKISFVDDGGMGKLENWIEDEEDWEGICPKCRKEWEEWYKNEKKT